MSCNKNKSKVVRNTIFEPYLSDLDIKNELGSQLLKGSLRINPRNYKEAYVTHQKLDSDIFLFDKDINRALFDDIVIIKINDKNDWKVLPELSNLHKIKELDNTNNSIFTIKALLKIIPNIFNEILKWNISDTDLKSKSDFNSDCKDWWKYFQRTGKVVGISNKMNSRHCVGCLSLPENMGDVQKSLTYVKFSPTDCRYPRLQIPVETCPKDFLMRPFDYKDVKFIAKIGDWKETDLYPTGEISRCLMDLSVVGQETIKILVESGFINEEFDEKVLGSLPSTVMEDVDLKYRRDMKGECVISIDPKTARDLDDALHIKRLPDLSPEGQPMWEVGVHIADVTYYVTPGSEIDKEASNRTTTVYMVHKAIPMLPRQLCENLCSLQPGTDKLAYSVIYQITDDCRIIDTWIGRTIIRTACQLSYEEAQSVLDNPTNTDWEAADFRVFSPFTKADVARSVLELNHLATQLRSSRFESGSLWINQPKLGFILSEDRTCPIGFNTYKLGASNHLIEEWMLLANMSVAGFLARHEPDTAFLRRHPPPTDQAINGLNKQLAQLGWSHLCLESGSTVAFQELLSVFPPGHVDHALLMNLCSKTMQLALYFCLDGGDSDSDCRHFALSVPLYTHFTSPIRRYPDMVVHRQLTEALLRLELDAAVARGVPVERDRIAWMERTCRGGSDAAELGRLADWCNKRRKDAKAADDGSVALFYSLFVDKCGPFTENAVVLGTLDKAFDVLLTHCGFIRRVYLNQLDVRDSQYVKNKSKLSIFWNRDARCSNQAHKTPITILSMQSCIDITVSTMPADSGNAAPRLKLVLPNPGCAACRKSRYDEPGVGATRDITSLLSEMKVVDVDQLYTMLDDI